MRKIDLTQGSQEWLDWRYGIITATDAAALLDDSPYLTTYRCWITKMDRGPEIEPNFAMRRGTESEPIARQMFNEQYDGMGMKPCCIESDLFPFLGASLDGLSNCGKYILEIKCQNIDKIKQYGVPSHHNHQMQHQMLCTDGQVELCYYVTIWHDEIYVVPVHVDTDWQKEYIPEAKKFWEMMTFREEPKLSQGDYVDMSEHTDWHRFATQYKTLAHKIKMMEAEKDLCRKELLRLCEDKSCSGQGLKVLKKQRYGSFDFKQIYMDHVDPEIDLTPYKAADSVVWTINIDTK